MDYIDVNTNNGYGVCEDESYYYRDILKNHEEELKSGHLSRKLVEMLIHLPEYINRCELNDLDYRIFSIYNHIMWAKYENHNEGKVDTSIIRDMVKHSIVIKEIYLFPNEDRIHDICQETYSELRNMYQKLGIKNIPESIDDDDDFNPEHISDSKFLVEFVLNKFPNEDYLKERASEIWKFI